MQNQGLAIMGLRWHCINYTKMSAIQNTKGN